MKGDLVGPEGIDEPQQMEESAESTSLTVEIAEGEGVCIVCDKTFEDTIPQAQEFKVVIILTFYFKLISFSNLE